MIQVMNRQNGGHNKTNLERITQQAVDLFEDEAVAEQWLSTSKTSLNDQTPLEAITSDAGAKEVEEILYRAEYGVFS
jgi:putative toxin-antitoxin system antitoxin component (TIGR02293 family)